MKVREKTKLLEVGDAKLLSSAVTSCKPALFVQRTVSPTAMVMLFGVKKLLNTVTSWVAATVVPATHNRISVEKTFR